VPPAVPFTTFTPARDEDGARHRRPGSRRSTSTWTVYAGAGLAALSIAAATDPVIQAKCGGEAKKKGKRRR
jgi:hypothetical protein